MNVLMQAAAEAKVSSKKLKRYTFMNYVVLHTNVSIMYYLVYLWCSCMKEDCECTFSVLRAFENQPAFSTTLFALVLTYLHLWMFNPVCAELLSNSDVFPATALSYAKGEPSHQHS